MILSVPQLVVAIVVVAIGSTVQGSVGFGLGLMAAPILMLIDPRMVPAPLLFASLSLTVLMSHRERQSIDVDGLVWALAGRLAGVLVGASMLAVLAGTDLALAVGGIVLASVALSACGVHVRPRPWTLVAAGTLSGFMGTVSSIGGPPMALLYQQSEGPRIRGTLSAFFVAGISLSLVSLRVIGRLGVAELALAASLFPGVLIGFAISARTSRVLDRGLTRAGILAVSAAAGILVVVKALW